MEIMRGFFSMRTLILILSLHIMIGMQILPAFAAETLRGQIIEGDFKTVKGFIEEVGNDKIKVLGEFYKIGNARIRKSSGMDVSRSVLTKGSEVEIHLKERDGVVTEVIFIRGHMYE